MSGHRNRPDRLDNPGPLLGRLRSIREELIKALTAVKPFGAIYHGLSMVIAAIDALAVLLTGERDYFTGLGSTASKGQQAAEATKRESES
jgi:hypothetical protein